MRMSGTTVSPSSALSSSLLSIYTFRKPSNRISEASAAYFSLRLSDAIFIVVFCNLASAICEATVRFQMRL